MDKLHPKENWRYFFSFLLALGVHLLMLLINYGTWGVPGGGEMRIIPVSSQLVEIETKPPVVPRPQPAPPPRPPVEEKKPEPPPREEVEALAQTTELTQEAPSSREVPPPEPEREEREEVVPPAPEERETPVEQAEQEESIVEEEVPPQEGLEVTGEENGEEPGDPPLPPLGDGAGMLGTYLVTYHKDLLHEGIEGNVRLSIILAEDGSFLREPEIIVSSGHPRLDEHCLMSVKMNWRFRPAPKPYRVVVEVSFVKTDPQPQIRFLGEATYYSPEGGELE